MVVIACVSKSCHGCIMQLNLNKPNQYIICSSKNKVLHIVYTLPTQWFTMVRFAMVLGKGPSRWANEPSLQQQIMAKKNVAVGDHCIPCSRCWQQRPHGHWYHCHGMPMHFKGHLAILKLYFKSIILKGLMAIHVSMILKGLMAIHVCNMLYGTYIYVQILIYWCRFVVVGWFHWYFAEYIFLNNI